mgnify:CR=1 FL=1
MLKGEATFSALSLRPSAPRLFCCARHIIITSMLLLVASVGAWQAVSKRQQPFQQPFQHAAASEVEQLASIPTWVVDPLPRLRFAREILSADDEAMQDLQHNYPQFWSLPLSKTLLPRHAFLQCQELPHGANLLASQRSSLSQLLLRPKTDAHFAEAVCAAAGGDRDMTAAKVLADFSSFASRFRRGGIEAARAGDAVVLRALSDHGWDPLSDRDKRGASALHYAAGHGHVECCMVLCEYGLDVNDRAAQDGASPLHWAVAGLRSRRSNTQQQQQQQQQLDNQRPQSDEERSGFGTGGHLSTCSWLVNRGADVGATTLDGNSILHWCAWAGQRPLLDWLPPRLAEAAASVEAGGGGGGEAVSSLSIHAINSKGCSAAHWSASGGDLEVCRALAEVHGVDFSKENLEGNTPLTKAVEHGREDIVMWLLTSGRCEEAVAEAAGYAARLAARHSADDTTERISELMQCYLLAQHYLTLGQPLSGDEEVQSPPPPPSEAEPAAARSTSSTSTRSRTTTTTTTVTTTTTTVTEEYDNGCLDPRGCWAEG